MEIPEPPTSPILDYASPKLQAPMRLASKSIITITSEANGIHIVESLTGQPQAVFAIVFASITVGFLGVVLFMASSDGSFTNNLLLSCLAFYSMMLIATLSVILAVIQSTWRRTILEIHSDQLSLIFTNPFKTRRRDWNTAEVRRVSCISKSSGNDAVHEVRIQVADDLLQLFTGHPRDELDDIALRIIQACRFPPMAQAIN